MVQSKLLKTGGISRVARLIELEFVGEQSPQRDRRRRAVITGRSRQEMNGCYEETSVPSPRNRSKEKIPVSCPSLKAMV